MSDNSSGMERRMVVQKLDVWHEARGDEGVMPMKTAIEQMFVEIAPLSFVLDVTDKNEEPTFASIGETVIELQETDLIGHPISAAKPDSLMGQIFETLSVVIDKKVPETVSGEFKQQSGQKHFHRCILMPLSTASEKIDIVMGAISFKTE